MTDRSGRVARHEVAGFSVCAFELAPGYRMGAHAHDRSGLVLPLAGRFRAVAGRRSLDVEGSHVGVLPGDAAHHETVGRDGAACLLVIPDVDRPRADGGLGLDLPRVAERPDLARMGRLLAAELRADPPAKGSASLVIEGLLLDLFAASPTTAAAKWSSAPSWIRGVESLVRNRLADPLTHEEIAREFGVSREHLARTFRRFAGLPLGGFVRKLRLQRAARGLRETSRPIAQIAFQCGFSDHSHLTRVFRGHFRQTPAEYRVRLSSRRARAS